MLRDDIIKRDVESELEESPEVGAEHIGVAVSKGIVTLTGHVSSYAEKRAAERAVTHVRGVRGIAQDIEVRLPFERRTSDEEIAQRAASIIEWDTQLAAGQILVRVQKGWITLMGIVPWQYQRQDAEAAVRKLSGVVGVTNRIEVRKGDAPSRIQSEIELALRRNAELSQEDIRVGFSNGSVTLSGATHSFARRNSAEELAWRTPGVREVVNIINVL